MTEFDAARYSITVRKESTEEGEMYVARVTELPDVAIYGDTYDYAYEGVLETIEAAKEMFDETDSPFPAPLPTANLEFSGRLNIRTSKSLHRTLVQNARHEGVSLNAHINQLLAQNVAYTNVCKRIESALIRQPSTDTLHDLDMPISQTLGESHVLN